LLLSVPFRLLTLSETLGSCITVGEIIQILAAAEDLFVNCLLINLSLPEPFSSDLDPKGTLEMVCVNGIESILHTSAVFIAVCVTNVILCDT
jgi:hypothetical protein